MAPISLKIVLDEGVVTKAVKFEANTTVADAQKIIKDKILTADDGKEYALFLPSADDDLSGIWMEPQRPLSFYMLRDGDSLLYLAKQRNLRVKMLDGSVKTLQVDQSKNVADLMVFICGRIGITNHDEYGLCREETEESEEGKESKQASTMGTLTLKRKAQQRERDAQMEKLSKKLKTDDGVEWLDQHKTLRELCVEPTETLILKRRLFYSHRNIDSRDPVQLNLLYVQTRDAILNGRHPVTEDQAQDCKTRWVHIRDVYRRILRKSINNPVQDDKLYKYHKELAFMIPFYKELTDGQQNLDIEVEYPDDATNNEIDKSNDDVRTYDTKQYDIDNDKDMLEEQPVEDNTDFEHVNVYDSEDSNKAIGKLKSKRRVKTVKSTKIIKRGTSSIQAAASSSSDVQTEFDPNDPVDSFLLGIGATLKKLTPYQLNLAKSKIFAVVQEHELEMIVNNTPQKKTSPQVKAKRNYHKVYFNNS